MNITDDTRDHRQPPAPSEWFDGWRVVTGVIATLFFAIGMRLFAYADEEHRKAEKCIPYDESPCEGSDDWAVFFLMLGVWILAFALPLALATIAPFGAWRRAFLFAAIGVLMGPFAIYNATRLVVSSPVVSAVLLAVTALVIILVRMEDRRKARGPGNARSQR